jgi:molybdate transport system substrate-binding protein
VRKFKSLIFLCFMAHEGRAFARVELTLSAAISLKPVLDELLPAYRARHQISVFVDYGASGLLARRILQGAPVDIFLSAAPEYVNKIDATHLAAAHSRRTFAKGALALVVPESNHRVKTFEDLARADIRHVSIGDPAMVPLGAYALEVLQHLKIDKQLAAKFIKAQNAKQVMTYVEDGHVDAGIVYQSDAAASAKIRVVQKADPSWHSPVLYEGVVLLRTKYASEAQNLLEYLVRDEVGVVLRRHGFWLPR